MTTVKTYFTQLPELTPRARELKLSIDYWMGMYQEARILSSVAWDEHIKAIDTGEDFKSINVRFDQATMLEDAAIEFWGNWQKMKAELLAFYN